MADAQAVTSARGNICGMHDGGQTYDSLMANRDLIAFMRNHWDAVLDVVEAATLVKRAWMASGDCRTYPLTPMFAAVARLEAITKEEG